MTDAMRCPRCGADGSTAGVSGMCASCLLELALMGPDDEPLPGEEGAPLVPEASYRVLTILGTDEYGTTYLGQQDRSRRLVTLQVVRLAQPFDEKRQRVFRERVARLSRLAHPAIQPIIEARRTAAGDGCVVSAFLNGPQLVHHCQSPRVDDAARLRLFSVVCDAVAYAHGQGACHGRLGPNAVIVKKADQVEPSPVVVGFGVFPDEPPGLDTDYDGLAAIARSMGWTGTAPGGWESIQALRERVCGQWR